MGSTEDASSENKDERIVFFFDIDNCLYPRSARIHDLMADLIDKYFQEHLNLSTKDAYDLHQSYYKKYGLAIEGLVRHHKINALDYNRLVDDALPLEDILHKNPTLRKLLLTIDKSKVKMWLFTNAHITHGKRVVKLLGIDDLFEGISFCDYSKPRLICKPHDEAFEMAMRNAQISDVGKCYFVDDSYLNVKRAHELGWKAALLLEPDREPPQDLISGLPVVSSLEELPKLFPEAFRSS